MRKWLADFSRLSVKRIGIPLFTASLCLGSLSTHSAENRCSQAADIIDQVQQGDLKNGLKLAHDAVALCDARVTELVLARVETARHDYTAAQRALDAARIDVYAEPEGSKRDAELDDIDLRLAMLAAERGPACAAIGAFDAAAHMIQRRHGELPDSFTTRRREVEAAGTVNGLSADDIRCTLQARQLAETNARPPTINGRKVFCAAIEIGVDVPVNFGTNAFTLDGPATQQVDELAKALRAQLVPDSSIEIVGHTDVRGSDNYNLALSLKRAETVNSVLRERLGLELGRATARGVGRVDPKYPGQSEEANRLNRRVEVKVTKPCP